MKSRISRRVLLAGSLGGAGAALLPTRRNALAKMVENASAEAPIVALNLALLAAMKAGGASVSQRFAVIAPAVDQAFDLETILKNSVGLHWDTLSEGDKNRLLATFRRYTVCSYVANFENWSGERFQTDTEPRVLSEAQVVVRTWLVPASGSPTELSYVMQQTSAGWKAVDVLASGTISRVAVQRSDFRGLLAKGGVSALVASLERKVNDLSGGALA